VALVGTEVVLESGMGRSLLFMEYHDRSRSVGGESGAGRGRRREASVPEFRSSGIRP